MQRRIARFRVNTAAGLKSEDNSDETPIERRRAIRLVPAERLVGIKKSFRIDVADDLFLPSAYPAPNPTTGSDREKSGDATEENPSCEPPVLDDCEKIPSTRLGAVSIGIVAAALLAGYLIGRRNQ